MRKYNPLITIKEVSDNYISKNIDLWEELVSNSNSDFIFSNYKWLKSFWQTYNDTFASKIYIAIDENTGQWLGILPLTKYKTGILDFNTIILSSTASEYSDYFSPIVRNQYRDKVLPILLERFLENSDNIHLFRLSNITEESDLNSLIADTLNKFGMSFSKSSSGCPILLFERQEKTARAARRSPNTRRAKKVGRAAAHRRRLEQRAHRRCGRQSPRAA